MSNKPPSARMETASEWKPHNELAERPMHARTDVLPRLCTLLRKRINCRFRRIRSGRLSPTLGLFFPLLTSIPDRDEHQGLLSIERYYTLIQARSESHSYKDARASLPPRSRCALRMRARTRAAGYFRVFCARLRGLAGRGGLARKLREAFFRI